ncbi:MAG: efflux RND transporter periplasmic adaptor subunit [Rhodospirillaceae bacterium]
MDTLAPKFAAAEMIETMPRRTRPTRLKLTVYLILMAVTLTLVVGGLYAFDQFKKTMIAKFFAGNVPPPATVSAVAATTEALPRFLDGIGTLTAVHQVTMAPEIAGRITAIMFEAGATVKAATPLVQLNDATDRADLANFQAQERLAQLNLGRSRTLAGKNFGTQQSVDQGQTLLDTARAGIAKAEAMIAQKLVRAPFSGRLGVRQVEIGQILSTGTPIVTLTDLDSLYVNFTLPEAASGAIKLGQTVNLRVDALPGRTVSAAVSAIEPQIDAATRSLKVQATLVNPGHLLLPGMFASVRVVLPPQENVVTLPETAVDYTAYGETVYLVREDAIGADGKPVLKAIQSFVKTGTRHDGKVAIINGVISGERVVIAGQVKLHNGSAVQLTPDTALTKPAQPPVH